MAGEVAGEVGRGTGDCRGWFRVGGLVGGFALRLEWDIKWRRRGRGGRRARRRRRRRVPGVARADIRGVRGAAVVVVEIEASACPMVGSEPAAGPGVAAGRRPPVVWGAIVHPPGRRGRASMRRRRRPKAGVLRRLRGHWRAHARAAARLGRVDPKKLGGLAKGLRHLLGELPGPWHPNVGAGCRLGGRKGVTHEGSDWEEASEWRMAGQIGRQNRSDAWGDSLGGRTR